MDDDDLRVYVQQIIAMAERTEPATMAARIGKLTGKQKKLFYRSVERRVANSSIDNPKTKNLVKLLTKLVQLGQYLPPGLDM